VRALSADGSAGNISTDRLEGGCVVRWTVGNDGVSWWCDGVVCRVWLVKYVWLVIAGKFGWLVFGVTGGA
jgi:hypothetical protein